MSSRPRQVPYPAPSWYGTRHRHRVRFATWLLRDTFATTVLIGDLLLLRDTVARHGPQYSDHAVDAAMRRTREALPL